VALPQEIYSGTLKYGFETSQFTDLKTGAVHFFDASTRDWVKIRGSESQKQKTKAIRIREIIFCGSSPMKGEFGHMQLQNSKIKLIMLIKVDDRILSKNSSSCK
jgi:hypothetical protein